MRNRRGVGQSIGADRSRRWIINSDSEIEFRIDEEDATISRRLSIISGSSPAPPKRRRRPERVAISSRFFAAPFA